MKKSILCCLIVVIVSMCFLSGTNVKEKIKLSELEDDELLAYIEDEGVFLPKGLKVSTIRKFIVMLEENPETPSGFFGFWGNMLLFEDLRFLVKENYHEIP